MMTRALIFANGEPNDGLMVRRALQRGRDARVIAADGGARVAQYFGLSVDVVVGDMDSLRPEELTYLQERGAEIERHPPEKDATDLELALHYAARHGINWIRVIGGIGGRFDQVLANVYLLALPELADCDIELAAGKQAIRLMRPGDHTLNGRPDDTLSLIPIGGVVTGITTDGLQYALNGDTLYFGPARGISNVLQGEQAHIHIDDGLLLCVHTVGRAD